MSEIIHRTTVLEEGIANVDVWTNSVTRALERFGKDRDTDALYRHLGQIVEHASTMASRVAEGVLGGKIAQEDAALASTTMQRLDALSQHCHKLILTVTLERKD